MQRRDGTYVRGSGQTGHAGEFAPGAGRAAAPADCTSEVDAAVAALTDRPSQSVFADSLADIHGLSEYDNRYHAVERISPSEILSRLQRTYEEASGHPRIRWSQALDHVYEGHAPNQFPPASVHQVLIEMDEIWGEAIDGARDVMDDPDERVAAGVTDEMMSDDWVVQPGDPMYEAAMREGLDLVAADSHRVAMMDKDWGLWLDQQAQYAT